MKNEIITKITEIMPRNESGDIKDKQLHSDLINAIQEMEFNILGSDIHGLISKYKIEGLSLNDCVRSGHSKDLTYGECLTNDVLKLLNKV